MCNFDDKTFLEYAEKTQNQQRKKRDNGFLFLGKYFHFIPYQKRNL